MRKVPVSALIAGACLVLSACGFQPLYAGRAVETLDNVTVSVSGDERLSYLTESALLERVGVSQGGAGTLSIRLRTAQQPLGRSTDGQATRVALNIRADYRLSGANPISGRVTERVVFETPREPYALIAARTNAERRASEVIADAIVRDILAGLRQSGSSRTRPETVPAGIEEVYTDDAHADEEPW